MKVNAADRTLASLAIATAVGIAAFWAAFFTVGLAPDRPPECYLAFERSFPLPDGALALALLAAGVLVRRGAPPGRALALVASGGLVFLGLLDLSFNLQQGVYASSTTDLAVNALINAWCVLLGLALALRFTPSFAPPVTAAGAPGPRSSPGPW